MKRLATFCQQASRVPRTTGVAVRCRTEATGCPGPKTLRKLVFLPTPGLTELESNNVPEPDETEKTDASATESTPEATPDDNPPTADSSNPGQGEVNAPASPDDAAAARSDLSDASPDGDELPEDEELTPELVEEEAIRGDFMLRWAAIFLALLFGFSQIADTRTLVHIRTGDAMRANGMLPLATDPHSFVLEQTPTANVSWGFDHLVSGVYAAGGEAGLTVFKALVAGGIAYVLSLISVSGMPTWWSSICCVLAISACSIDFLPTTDIVTLSGLVIVLLLLHRYQEGTTAGLLWKLPLTILLWANLDTHAYLGVLAIGLFAVGSQWKRSLLQQQNDGPTEDVFVLWKAMAISAAMLLVNPSPLASVLSVVDTYRVEYPTMAEMRPLTDSRGNAFPAAVLLDGRTEYFPLWTPEVHVGFEFAYVSGLAILLIAVVVLAITRNRDDLPWIVTLAGFTSLTLIAVHELPAAALVAAVVAGTAGQRWYGKTFRQEYSVDPSEVLFSRGGRAVTVFAFAGLGFFAVADRLPTRTPIGLGFEGDLKTTMDSLGEQFSELPEASHVLQTRIEHGDLLIWHGRKSFIDSRVRPFGSYADTTSPIYEFDALRKSMVGGPAEEAEASADSDSPAVPIAVPPPTGPEQMYDPQWKSRFAELGITHAMIRMSPPGAPAYRLASVMMQSADWVMTNRGPSALFFELVTDPSEIPEPYDLAADAFRSSESQDLEQFDFGREPDFYQKYLYARRRTLNAPLRDAQHFLFMNCQAPFEAVLQVATAAVAAQGDAAAAERKEYMTLLGTALAGPVLTIRRANEALLLDPQDALAHRVLGSAYTLLNRTESAIAAAYNGSAPESVRYMQAVMALRQAATIQPDVPETWEGLMELYQMRGRTGLALECLESYLALEEEDLEADPESEARLRQLYEMQRTWRELRENVQTQVDEALAGSMPEDPQEHARQKFGLVQQLSTDGYTRIALRLMKQNVDLLRQIPQAELLRGELLLETGELEDGFTVLNQLASVARDNPQRPGFEGLRWHGPVALSRLARADYAGAVEAWGDQLAVFENAQDSPELARTMMQALPLVPAVETQIGGTFASWPLLTLQAAQLPMLAIPAGQYEPTFLRALASIESGNIANAKFILEGLLTDGGDNPLRPLASVYLYQLSDTADALLAESSLSLWQEGEYPDVNGVEPAESIDDQNQPPPDKGDDSNQ